MRSFFYRKVITYNREKNANAFFFYRKGNMDIFAYMWRMLWWFLDSLFMGLVHVGDMIISKLGTIAATLLTFCFDNAIVDNVIKSFEKLQVPILVLAISSVALFNLMTFKTDEMKQMMSRVMKVALAIAIIPAMLGFGQTMTIALTNAVPEMVQGEKIEEATTMGLATSLFSETEEFKACKDAGGYDIYLPEMFLKFIGFEWKKNQTNHLNGTARTDQYVGGLWKSNEGISPTDDKVKERYIYEGCSTSHGQADLISSGGHSFYEEQTPDSWIEGASYRWEAPNLIIMAIFTVLILLGALMGLAKIVDAVYEVMFTGLFLPLTALSNVGSDGISDYWRKNVKELATGFFAIFLQVFFISVSCLLFAEMIGKVPEWVNIWFPGEGWTQSLLQQVVQVAFGISFVLMVFNGPDKLVQMFGIDTGVKNAPLSGMIAAKTMGAGGKAVGGIARAGSKAIGTVGAKAGGSIKSAGKKMKNDAQLQADTNRDNKFYQNDKMNGTANSTYSKEKEWDTNNVGHSDKATAVNGARERFDNMKASEVDKYFAPKHAGPKTFDNLSKEGQDVLAKEQYSGKSNMVDKQNYNARTDGATPGSLKKHNKARPRDKMSKAVDKAFTSKPNNKNGYSSGATFNKMKNEDNEER